MSTAKAHRVLLIDDTPAIHQDFRKLLSPARRVPEGLDDDEAALFGTTAPPKRSNGHVYELDCAMQGREGVDMVSRAARAKRPYALIFIDMRMPPGWDGVATAEHIVAIAPGAELCICSAYSDYSWHEVIRRVGRAGLRHLRKPFDTRDVLVMAAELTERWDRTHGGGT
jgi:CheY-like chemotaxis protein